MKKGFIFLGGLITGAVITYFTMKNKCEEYIQKEIKEVKDELHNRHNDVENEVIDVEETEEVKDTEDANETEEVNNTEDAENHQEYNDIINEYAPSNEVKISEIEREDDPRFAHIVTPEDFGSIEGYDYDSLYWHPNNVVTNNTDTESIHPDELYNLVGMSWSEIESHFGEYEDDTVFVRNNDLKCDYEILRTIEDFEERY